MKPKNNSSFMPLAARMRPNTIADFIGQTHLLDKGKPLRIALHKGILHSMILWGPPGTGKTTLAQILASAMKAQFVKISAISASVKDIRGLVIQAKRNRKENGVATILFVDEVHRFNKAQQDIFLPFVEEGTFTLIGATTENPSFELNSALLSRTRVYVLKALSLTELITIIDKALNDKINGLGKLRLNLPTKLKNILAKAADGDARIALNLLEILADFAKKGQAITEELLTAVLQESLRRFDKGGEQFYNQISALHKAVRGSSPNAALYWFARMVDGGCDPRYIARRVIRMAYEDIGLADPRAQEITLHAAKTYERLGSPEGELAIATAIVYLAVAAKSNAVYGAYKKAQMAVKMYGSLEVPLHLRNAPTALMKNLNYGKEYRYAHDEEDAYAACENYFPEELKDQQFYFPTNRGLEEKIAAKLKLLKEKDNNKK